jgi:hypothetical protein
MPTTAADVLGAMREFSVQERREFLSELIREIVSKDGRDEAIRWLFECILDRDQSPDEREAETLAALMKLPIEVAAAALEPFDPNEIRIEDCLSDEEVEQILAGKPD